MIRLFRKKKKKFPTFPVILLVAGIIWLINEIGLVKIDLPWIPIIVIIVAIGMIVNRYSEE